MFALVTKYGVAVSLAVAACFSGFCQLIISDDGEIHCETSAPFKIGDDWYVTVECTGYLSSREDVKVSDQGGGCTNCTAMTPAQCEEYKAFVTSRVDEVQLKIPAFLSEIQVLQLQVNQALTTISMIKNEGDQFVSYGSYLRIPPDGSAQYADKSATLLAGPTAPYITSSMAVPPTVTAQMISYAGGNEAVYNYYHNAVGPLLDSTVESLMGIAPVTQNMVSNFAEMQSDLTAIKDYVSNIPCLACVRGGSDSGGGGSSSACPCSEVLEHIKNLVQEKRDILKDWDDNQLPKLKKRLDKWQSMIKVIQDAVAPIGTNFLYAVNFKDINNQSFSFPDKHDQLWQNGEFDFGEYGNLTWFSRIEYLLLNLNGIFDKTNSVAEVEEALKKAEDSLGANASHEASIESSLTQLSQSSFDRISTAIATMFESFQFFGSGQSSIQGAVIISGNLNGFIRGLDNVQVEAFSGNQQLIHSVDRLVAFVRVCFQVIYAAVFLFLYYICSVFLFHRISKLVIWLCSFYSSVFGS